MTAPLAGVRVVDVTSTMLGPFCSVRLAEMGAEVIKIEPPVGDVTRQGPGGEIVFTSGFLNITAGKRSVVLDLKRQADKRALDAICAGSEVFLHNMPAPTAARLGIDEASVRAVSPAIVYCAADGYGEDGPYAARPAYDDVIQAMPGLAAAQHASVERPTYISSPVVDKTVAVTAALAIAAALVRRVRDGVGASIEVPMFEVMSSYVLQETLGGAAFEPRRGPTGSRIASPYRRPYRTADGYLSLLLLTDEQVRRFLQLIGREDLLGDERLVTLDARAKNLQHFHGTVEEILSGRPTSEWLDLLVPARLPAGPVHTFEDLLDDPHLEAVGFFQMIDHPDVGLTRRPRSGIRFADHRVDVAPAPARGADTEAVLREFGVDDETVAVVLGKGTS